MKQKDAELIQRVLQHDDQDAFSLLVRKYQKGVHALAWRKIGDFHIAQEITQDAFFRAYQKLRTLKNHNQFAGWLYVIAARLCADWFEKKSLPEQSLEVTDTSEVNKVSYSRYVAEKQAAETHETRREVVKKLLQKLPESERTVMTLHYLGEMTIKAISEFLGVSPNTVKSRLSRARNRLKKEEDMIRQNLGSFQLPANLTQDIMNEISRIVPTAPAANKPVVPWVLSAASAVIIFLLMGAGTQYLSRFQKPYDLNATSERTVELIEAVLVLDSPAKPAVRNQAGSTTTPGRNPGAGQKPDARLFAAALTDETEVSTPKLQWIQTKGPTGGIVSTLFTTTGGDIYAATSTNLYKMANDGHSWKLVNAGSSTSLNLQDFIMGGTQQMVESDNAIYVATNGEILTSTDYGETWTSLGEHPKGQPIGIVITDEVIGTEADRTLNLGLVEGVFRSVDAGKSWIPLNNGNLKNRKIRAITAVENTLFAGTDSGLYRLSANTWEKLSINQTDMPGDNFSIHALAVDEHRLYVATGDELTNQNQRGRQFKSSMTGSSEWSLYRSTDQGDTWYSIDPWKRQEREAETQRQALFDLASPFPGAEATEIYLPSLKIFAGQGRVMVVDAFGAFFYSMNTGESWTALDVEHNSGYNIPPAVLMLDANTFYRGGAFGVQVTIDAGKTWYPFNTGLVDVTVRTLIAVKGKLYANDQANGFVTSTDGGESWTPLPRGIDHGVFIEAFDDALYIKRGNQMNSPSPLCRLSTEDHSIAFIDDMPAFGRTDSQNTGDEIGKILTETLNKQGVLNLEEGAPPNPEELNGILNEALKDVDLDQLNETLNKALQEGASAGMMSFIGSFAVSDDTYYVEYMQKLFRWKPDTPAWHDTGLIDETEPPSLFTNLDYSTMNVSESLDLFEGFELTVSGKTVYVGKRDGHLFQSFDEGDTWNDVTANIPFSFEKFKAITFAGATVYVATDTGVAYSSDGTHWHAATHAEGKTLLVDRLAVEGTTVYGQAEQYVYQLKEGSNIWKQATPEIPSDITALAVDGDMLYVGTMNRGVLRFKLDE